ncbi:hypothetical protein FA15DRAFT_669599 [Coprinopsis marcescibilis]|uniref:DUF3752 domain-containing protein n=1 Tax=Coprinopsis marcescibilis TaxID=230819 RepID=A0A5C3KUQ1_COPMA|nr:hypothetical protein FA15DRAFT_669599 [Coprinopsis marcescibilis]
MANIGPQLPPHLQHLQGSNVGDSDEEDVGPVPPSVGPQIPPGYDVQRRKSDNEGEATGPTAGPTIPAHLLKKRNTSEDKRGNKKSMGPVAGPSRPSPERQPATGSSNKRVLGPTLPSYGPTYDPRTFSRAQDEDDSDDDVGPKPLPAGMKHEESDAVKEFIEKEERRKKHLEESNKPKAAKRDEWMLVPPSHSDLLGNLDPTKMKKGRQFSKNTAERSNDMSLWTETPAERQQRLADEITGKKRRAADTAPIDDDVDKKKRKQEEALIRRGVEEHTKKKRGGALVEQHAAAAKTADSDEAPVIWDHARDMAIGGRLMDDGKRDTMLKEAKGLGSRFSSGKSGGFL